MTDSALNYFVASGTNAERLAFTPDPGTPPGGPDPSYRWFETDTGSEYAWDYDGATWELIGGGGAVTALSTSLSQVSSSLSSEISSRASGDTSLSTVISSEVSSRASGDASLSTVISSEVSSRASGDTSLSTVISGSISTVNSSRLSGDTSLSTAVSTAFSNVSFRARLITTVTAASFNYNVNSTSYIANASHTFRADFDDMPWDEYRIVINGSSNAGGETITAQLATFAAPTTPIHTGGDDVVITNSSGTFDSGWKSRDDGVTTGTKNYCIVFKGSNATVDLNIIFIEIWFR